jgi:hypothetical protein
VRLAEAVALPFTDMTFCGCPGRTTHPIFQAVQSVLPFTQVNLIKNPICLPLFRITSLCNPKASCGHDGRQ